jgi:hypothetical protein
MTRTTGLSARAQSTTNDPRVGLKPGLYDAGVAAKGLQLVAHRNKPDVFHPNEPGGLTYANSDLAFGGHYLYQGNFSGLEIWDIANPMNPTLTTADLCFTEQGDVSVYGHLLFVSAENTGSRLDCGTQGIQDSVSTQRMLGVRIFDVADPQHPKEVADVQTCRGSHTHAGARPDGQGRCIRVRLRIGASAVAHRTWPVAQPATSRTPIARCFGSKSFVCRWRTRAGVNRELGAHLQ